MSSKVKLAADYIHAHIQDGSWPLNSCIPSEHELCAELGISRTSVRGAIAQMMDQADRGLAQQLDSLRGLRQDLANQ